MTGASLSDAFYMPLTTGLLGLTLIVLAGAAVTGYSTRDEEMTSVRPKPSAKKVVVFAVFKGYGFGFLTGAVYWLIKFVPLLEEMYEIGGSGRRGDYRAVTEGEFVMFGMATAALVGLAVGLKILPSLMIRGGRRARREQRELDLPMPFDVLEEREASRVGDERPTRYDAGRPGDQPGGGEPGDDGTPNEGPIT